MESPLSASTECVNRSHHAQLSQRLIPRHAPLESKAVTPSQHSIPHNAPPAPHNPISDIRPQNPDLGPSTRQDFEIASATHHGTYHQYRALPSSRVRSAQRLDLHSKRQCHLAGDQQFRMEPFYH
jgi:hypothetical protein